MPKNIMIIPFLFIFIVVGSCNNDPITPDNIKTGSRNYTWTIDTVYEPFNSFTSITGTSPNNLWTANPGDNEKIFYHFDGMKWTTDLMPRNFSPYSIFSLNVDNIWSAGLQGKIWQYNATQWVEQYKYSLGDSVAIYFRYIYAISQYNVYAIGAYTENENYWGLVLFFNGYSWTRIDIPKVRTLFTKIIKDSNGKFYLLGVTNEQFTESTYQLYEFDGKTLTQINSGSQNNTSMGGIIELGNQVYFIIGFDLYSYINNSFTKIGRLSDLPEFLNVGFGRSTKDIFLGMRNGIAHYNGMDTEYLIKTEENTFIRYGIVFEKDVFMMGRDSKGNNLIYHGKLNE